MWETSLLQVLLIGLFYKINATFAIFLFSNLKWLSTLKPQNSNGIRSCWLSSVCITINRRLSPLNLTLSKEGRCALLYLHPQVKRSFTLLSDCPTHTTRGLNDLSLPAFKWLSPFLPFFSITRNPFERLHCDSVLEICSINSEPQSLYCHLHPHYKWSGIH